MDEVGFPFEFVVAGTPVSHQAKGNRGKESWREAVRSSARSRLVEPFFAPEKPVAIVLYYFPPEPMDGDIDNIVKLVVDALVGTCYADDRLVERLVVQKFEPGAADPFSEPPPLLALALSEPRPQLYVRVTNDVGERGW